MAPLTMTDAKIYLGGYNFSGMANELTADLAPAILNSTTFGLFTVRNQVGLHDVKIGAKGFNELALGVAPGDVANSPDSVSFGRVGSAMEVMSFAPVGNSELDVAYLTRGVNGQYSPIDGAVGALLGWNLDLVAAGTRLVRGSVLGVGLKTVTGNSAGTALNIVGGVLAGQVLYASLHVISTSGTTPTLNVVVESAAANTFASPTTRLTFPQFTTSVGASWQQISGPITDAWYRLKWTLAGTTPQYTIFGVIGVL